METENSATDPQASLDGVQAAVPTGTSAAASAPENAQGPSAKSPNGEPDEQVLATKPEFYEMKESKSQSPPYKLDRFRDVKITVWAELGRVTMPISELLQLGRGSVVKLNRSLSEPVDIMAQGVRLARGEVVVVDDCFAVRIKEIDSLEDASPD